MRKDNLIRQFARYSSLAFLLPASVVAGFLIGYLLDKAFGTSFLKVVILLLGIASGAIELLRELRKADAGK